MSASSMRARGAKASPKGVSRTPLTLELAHDLGHRGLRDAEHARRGADAHLLDHRDEGVQLVGFHGGRVPDGRQPKVIVLAQLLSFQRATDSLASVAAEDLRPTRIPTEPHQHPET